MMETFRSFDLMLQTYWILALCASVVFVIQGIMTFIGLDADYDADATDAPDVDSDFDADGFHLVSVKTVVSFILGFGWTGVLLWDNITSPLLLGFIALVVGFLFMFMIAWLLYLVLKLDRDNTFKIQKVVGMNADVYLTIPANKAETGKITVSLNGSMHELEALTTDDAPIQTGGKVKIVGIETGVTVLVTAL